MKRFEIKAEFTIYEHEDELSQEERELLRWSREAATRADAGYSHFQVGAALLLENGKIITGNNQENSVYQGLCAERTAAFSAAARYPGVPFKMLVITAINPQEKLTKPVPPCGACRQVLFEYETKYGKNITILMAGQEGEIWKVNSAAELLPLTFSSAFLPV
ncbi:MAG: cytidine deaminase [Bacteroidales bacterium]|nr:cytidine deaminase [Bacteroidales bacterium]